MPDGRVSRWRTVRRWREELRRRLGFDPTPPPPSIPPQPTRFPTAPVTAESFAAREMGPRLRELQTQLHPRPPAPPPPRPEGIESAGQAAWQLAQIPRGFTEQALANLREIIAKARREEFPQQPQMPPAGGLARRIGRGIGQFAVPIFPEEGRGSALEAAMMFPPFAAGREIGPVLPAIQKAMGAAREARAGAAARMAESLAVPGRAEAGFAAKGRGGPPSYKRSAELAKTFKPGDRVKVTPKGETQPIDATVEGAYAGPFGSMWKVRLDDGRVLQSGYSIELPTAEAVVTPAAKKSEAVSKVIALESQLEQTIKSIEAKRFKSANDIAQLERAKRILTLDVGRFKAGQGVGWRPTGKLAGKGGQVNRGYVITEVIPETKEAIIQPVGDIGQLADFTPEAQRVKLIDLIRDKKYDLSLKPPIAPPTPRVEPVPPGVAKEPWQETKDGFALAKEDVLRKAMLAEIAEARAQGRSIVGIFSADKIEAVGKQAEIEHRQIIAMALREGKPVPPEVLADYPDLAKAIPKAEAVRPVVPAAGEGGEIARALAGAQVETLVIKQARIERLLARDVLSKLTKSQQQELILQPPAFKELFLSRFGGLTSRNRFSKDMVEAQRLMEQRAVPETVIAPQAAPTIPPSLVEGPPPGVKVAKPTVPPAAEELTIFPKAAEITPPPPGGPPLLERTPHDEVLAQIKAQREAIAARRKAGEKISVRMGKRAKGPIPLGPEEIPPVPSERALALRPPVELPPPDVPPSAFAKEVVTEKGGLPAFTLFNQPTEELLRIAKSEGIPVDMLKYAQGEARTISPELNAFSRLVHPLRVVIDPIKRLHPDVQDAYLLRSRIGQADRLQVQAGATGISRMLSELLGETTAKAALEGKRIPELASLFKGKVVPSQEPYIGTVRHVLDFSERYELPYVWRRFVSEWNGIHDSNLAILVNRLGVKTGEVKDIYVSQSIVAKEGARGIPGRPLGKPGVFKPRKMDTDQFYGWAAGQGYQVKTDLLDLFLSRMTSAGNLKADITFLDALALKSGGKRLGMGVKPGMGEGMIQQRGISWLLPEDIAADAKTALAPSVGGEEAAVNAIVDNLKAALLQFDFSLMGMRQGLLAFTANPVGTLQGYGRIWQMLRSPEAQAAWLAQNVERMMFYSQRGAKLQVSPLELPTHALGGPAPLIERVPGVAWLNHVQFNLGMPVLKLSLMEKNLATLRAIQGSEGLAGLTHKVPGLGKVVKGLGGKLYKMSDDDLVKVAIDAASNHVGGVESARYVAGRTSALRNLLILTENWTRAQIGIVVNLPKFSPQGILARRMLMQEMLFAVGLAAVTGTITGKGFSLDPRSRIFGKVWIPGVGYVSFLPHAALIRTVARGIAGLPEGEFGAEKPWWQQRVETLWGWSDGRAGQIPHLVTDLARGVDYAGRQIENKALYALKELAPIPGQNLKEAWTRGTDLKGLGVNAIFSVAGADVTPQSSRDALAELAGVSSMDELEPKQRIQLEMTPGARAVRKKAGATQAQRRRELAYDYFDSQLARDMLRAQGKMSKDQWRDSYYREKAKFAAQRDAWDKAFGIKYPDSKKPEEQALSGYYELFELYTDPVTKLFDGEGFELAEAEYLMALSVPLRDYVERNLGSYATPTVERFQTAKRQFLGTYWDLDKAFLETLPEAQRGTWFDYIQLKQQNSDKAAIVRKATPLLRTLETKFNEYKLGWRIKNQEADDALVEWYGYVPASEQLPKRGRRPPPKWPTPKAPTGARRG